MTRSRKQSEHLSCFHSSGRAGQFAFTFGVFLLAGLLYSCAGPPPAPMKDRSARSGNYQYTPDGHYRVRRGDSLHAIAFKFGLDWREIARLNGISSPYTIYPDQILRLTTTAAPVADARKEGTPAVKISSAPSPAETTTRKLEAPRSSTRPSGETDSNASGSQYPKTREKPAPATAAASASRGSQAPAGSTYSTPAGDPDRWLWPTEGKLLSNFVANDPSRKGIDIGGRAGQPVIATAAGQVVYSGNGLIGYGELIIIKHSDRMLSAYAHNSKRLVDEGQQVTAGSRIAEMGTNDRNQAVLHFEIRVNGNPRDPLEYLPRK